MGSHRFCRFDNVLVLVQVLLVLVRVLVRFLFISFARRRLNRALCCIFCRVVLCCVVLCCAGLCVLHRKTASTSSSSSSSSSSSLCTNQLRSSSLSGAGSLALTRWRWGSLQKHRLVLIHQIVDHVLGSHILHGDVFELGFACTRLGNRGQSCTLCVCHSPFLLLLALLLVFDTRPHNAGAYAAAEDEDADDDEDKV